VVTAVVLKRDASDRQTVLVVERMVAKIRITAPAVMAETPGGGSVAFEANFEARRMGIS
jgi:hypothetical protein